MLVASLASASAFVARPSIVRSGAAFAAAARRSFSRSTISMMANPKGELIHVLSACNVWEDWTGASYSNQFPTSFNPCACAVSAVEDTRRRADEEREEMIRDATMDTVKITMSLKRRGKEEDGVVILDPLRCDFQMMFSVLYADHLLLCCLSLCCSFPLPCSQRQKWHFKKLLLRNSTYTFTVRTYVRSSIWGNGKKHTASFS